MLDLEQETTTAIRDCLAPLKLASAQLYDRVVGYVLTGEAPHVLHVLASQEPLDVALVARPDASFAEERLDAVAEAHPGWTQDGGEAARRTAYRVAPAPVLARFGRLLTAVAGLDDADAAERFARLVDDVGRLVMGTHGHEDSRGSSDGVEETRARWTPELMYEVVREYGLPDDAAVAVVLQVLVRRDRTSPQRRGLVLNPAVDAFLARHTVVLARVVTALDPAGKQSFFDLAARNLEVHAGLVARLAVDKAPEVRAGALGLMTRLADDVQVRALAPHLARADPDRLGDAVAYLATVDGGIAGLGDALAGMASGTIDEEREHLLRRALNTPR
jgi:hypothetical protein